MSPRDSLKFCSARPSKLLIVGSSVSVRTRRPRPWGRRRPDRSVRGTGQSDHRGKLQPGILDRWDINGVGDQTIGFPTDIASRGNRALQSQDGFGQISGRRLSTGWMAAWARLVVGSPLVRCRSAASVRDRLSIASCCGREMSASWPIPADAVSGVYQRVSSAGWRRPGDRQ
jgi:hypothetical protein